MKGKRKTDYFIPFESEKESKNNRYTSPGPGGVDCGRNVPSLALNEKADTKPAALA
jgi:hypothetical protein